MQTSWTAPRIRSRLTRALALAAAVLGLAALPAAATAAPIQLGAYVREASGSAQTLEQFSNLIGRSPSIVMWYRGIEQPLLYSSESANLAGREVTPMVSLEPVDPSGNDLPLSKVAAGAYDSYLRTQAQQAKAWGRRILIRFAYEMNLGPQAEIPWGGGAGAYSGNDAADYIAAWRHVVSLFRAEGATNAEFVWAPNIDDGGIPFSQYFPGDEWVDAVGLDGYNWGSTKEAQGHTWLSLGDTFASSYATLTSLSSKPVMITETASTEQGGNKAQWIENGFLNEIPQRFPRVDAVIYFDVSKETDWQVDSSQASLQAFRKVAASSLYGGPVPYQPAAPTTEVASAPVVEAVQVTKQVAGAGSSAGAPAQQHAAKKAAHRRGKIRYRVSRKATVSVTVERRGKRLRRMTLRRGSHTGVNTIRFSRRIAGHRLTPGRYRVTVETVSGGRHSEKRASFRVLGR